MASGLFVFDPKSDVLSVPRTRLPSPHNSHSNYVQNPAPFWAPRPIQPGFPDKTPFDSGRYETARHLILSTLSWNIRASLHGIAFTNSDLSRQLGGNFRLRYRITGFASLLLAYNDISGQEKIGELLGNQIHSGSIRMQPIR